MFSLTRQAVGHSAKDSHKSLKLIGFSHAYETRLSIFASYRLAPTLGNIPFLPEDSN